MTNRLTVFLLLALMPVLAMAQKKQTNKYVIVARFISYGAGVPKSKPVLDFVKSFEKKNKTKTIKVDTIGPRGREGEYGLGFYLRELNEKQRHAFVQQIKKVKAGKGDNGEIQYEENVTAEEANIPGHGRTQTIKIE